MSRTRRRVLAATGLFVLVTVVIVITVVLTQSGRPAQFERQVAFPALWTPSYPDDDVPWQGAEVHLVADGGAYLVNAPGGELQQNDGASCVARSQDLFTGSATWVIDARGIIEISYSGGTLILLPDQGKFGSVDWYDVSAPFCGTEPAATFGLRSDPKSQVD